MTWHPDPRAPRVETQAEREARIAWEQGGASFLPSAGRVADRISTILILAFGAVLTVVIGIVAAVAITAGTASCDAAAGCSPGAMIGGGALAVGGAFLIGVATVVLSIAAWVRRRSSWWIAAIGFVLATGCVVGGRGGVRRGGRPRLVQLVVGVPGRLNRGVSARGVSARGVSARGTRRKHGRATMERAHAACDAHDR